MSWIRQGQTILLSAHLKWSPQQKRRYPIRPIEKQFLFNIWPQWRFYAIAILCNSPTLFGVKVAGDPTNEWSGLYFVFCLRGFGVTCDKTRRAQTWPTCLKWSIKICVIFWSIKIGDTCRERPREVRWPGLKSRLTHSPSPKHLGVLSGSWSWTCGRNATFKTGDAPARLQVMVWTGNLITTDSAQWLLSLGFWKHLALWPFLSFSSFHGLLVQNSRSSLNQQSLRPSQPYHISSHYETRSVPTKWKM